MRWNELEQKYNVGNIYGIDNIECMEERKTILGIEYYYCLISSSRFCFPKLLI